MADGRGFEGVGAAILSDMMAAVEGDCMELELWCMEKMMARMASFVGW